jgi:plasmid stabilization system protein ParE
MAKYRVVVHPDAEIDIASSYQWGKETWGEDQAKTWANKLRRSISNRLTTLPLACPVAPESEELGLPVRQLVIQRYRVLFLVNQRTVTILHVRGPYIADVDAGESGLTEK